jgi:predicted DCC family thiol-disulfide oxidoreductase YuxK
MNDFRVEVFYDGDCPLCMREIRFLQRLDRRAQIRFTNIAEPEFDAAKLGIDHATLMRKIHGRSSNGRWFEGVEVFRQLYEAVGFRRLVAASRAPGIAQLLDVGYEVFAKNRLRLTGRCDADSCNAQMVPFQAHSPLKSSKAEHSMPCGQSPASRPPQYSAQ